MAEIGHTLAPPYKIVILMRDISDRDEISRRYQNYRLQFDADAIETLRSQQDIIGIIFL